MYQMRSFPSLDSYMSKRRDKVNQTVHAKIENRIEALMKERYTHFVCIYAFMHFYFVGLFWRPIDLELSFLPQVV